MILKQVSDQLKIFKDMGMNKWRETKMAHLKKRDTHQNLLAQRQAVGSRRRGNLHHTLQRVS